ncbi:MAG TPA: DUF3426 domain-containing protein, partial [Quisquiliibacterium sp.]|nr:DUF3426 domain-containing protein [Quisquiliibacterium sp.]
FKVVPDQLKLRRGLVRCGMCQHVFSGIDFLRYVDESARPADPGGLPAGTGDAAKTPGAVDPGLRADDRPHEREGARPLERADGRPDARPHDRPGTPAPTAPDQPFGTASVPGVTADTRPPPTGERFVRGTSTDEAIATGTWLAEPGAAPLEWRPSGPPSIVTSPGAADAADPGARREADADTPDTARIGSGSDTGSDSGVDVRVGAQGALPAVPGDALLWHTAGTPDVASEAELEATAEAASEAASEPIAEAASEPIAESESSSEAEAGPEAGPDASAGSEAEPNAEPGAGEGSTSESTAAGTWVDASARVHPDRDTSDRNTSDGEDAIDFFATDRRPRGFDSRASVFRTLAGVLLVLAALVQATITGRDRLAVWFPQLAGPLAALVEPLGLSVAPPRDLDALTIEAFELRPGDSADLLTMNALLRNHSRYTVRWPAMELSLIDAGGGLAVRKVLLPAEYLTPAGRADEPGIGAHAEFTVRVVLRARDVEATGYTVNLFYP